MVVETNGDPLRLLSKNDNLLVIQYRHPIEHQLQGSRIGSLTVFI